MPNPFKNLIAPKLPRAAIGLSGEGVSAVALDRRRGGVLSIQRAAFAPLPEGLLRPNFDGGNVQDPAALADTLAELAASTGMQKRRRWSVALPEAATRTSILTLETQPTRRGETEEMLRWKTERAMAAPLDELRVSRERLRPDPQGRARYLVTAVRLAVLDEYEAVFAGLGWHAGLILPRHMGEAWLLMRDAAGAADSLLVSSHSEGFTAVVLRRGQPLLVRGVICDEDDRADELYRFLLFYRDRLGPAGEDGGEFAEGVERLMVAGTGLGEEQTAAIVAETLAAPPLTVRPEDVRLSFPSTDLDFGQIAAPAGLAALGWA